MYIYIYEGFSGGADRKAHTDELVLRSVEAYIKEKNIYMEKMSREIERTEKGKPYFKELPFSFSVSHTDNLWVCLMSEGSVPIGIDIQRVKKTHQEKVADRYFTDDEKAELLKKDENVFFKIWTRKEAYAKYTGKGLTKELSEISTLNNSEVEFVDFDIRADIKGSCCVKEKGELCLRAI